jgi:hypothetical protein
MLPTKFPRLTNRDLKLTSSTTFAHNDLTIPHLKTPALQVASAVFRFNISSIRLMMLVPAHLADLSLRMQHLLDVAILETTGKITDQKISPEDQDKIDARWKELLDVHLTNELQKRDNPNWHSEALLALQGSTSLAEMLGSIPSLSKGLEAMLSFYVTGVWTAFEIMCGDLWESAVNAYPGRLAHLKGKSSQLVKSRKQSNYEESEGLKTKYIPLDQLKRHSFDIKNKMGTILRDERFEFSRLSDIRLAYGQAFDIDFSKIEDALLDGSIESLRTLRNLIVHKAGRVDDDYLKLVNTQKLPTAPLGQTISLDGSKVVEMISPVIATASRLLSAVDDWVIKHGATSE